MSDQEEEVEIVEEVEEVEEIEEIEEVDEDQLNVPAPDGVYFLHSPEPHDSTTLRM